MCTHAKDALNIEYNYIQVALGNQATADWQNCARLKINHDRPESFAHIDLVESSPTLELQVSEERRLTGEAQGTSRGHQVLI